MNSPYLVSTSMPNNEPPPPPPYDEPPPPYDEPPPPYDEPPPPYDEPPPPYDEQPPPYDEPPPPYDEQPTPYTAECRIPSPPITTIAKDLFVKIKLDEFFLQKIKDLNNRFPPYSEYPNSCMDRVLYILNYIKSETFMRLIQHKEPKTLLFASELLTTSHKMPIELIKLKITDVINQLDPGEGCMIMISYLYNTSVGHVIICTKDNNGIVFLVDPSLDTNISDVNEYIRINNIDEYCVIPIISRRYNGPRYSPTALGKKKTHKKKTHKKKTHKKKTSKKKTHKKKTSKKKTHKKKTSKKKTSKKKTHKKKH